MASQGIFVGRKLELNQFKKILERSQGEAILVVGQEGMGKTQLLNKLVSVANNHPNIQCWAGRYDVVPTDEVNDTMEIILNSVLEVVKIKERNLELSPKTIEKIKEL